MANCSRERSSESYCGYTTPHLWGSSVNKGFLQWARNHSKLKVVTASVPVGILPAGIYAVLHDIKVFVKHGPDDLLYDADEEIRSRVARGNCLLEVTNCSEAGVYCVTYGMKKFTGGLGDDDDKDRGDDFTWRKYFTKPMDEATHVICTRKVNGEAAHLGAIEIRQQIYMVAGSKNVHLLFRSREDVEKYEGDRYRIAKEVAEAVIDLVDAMTTAERDRLLQFLCESNVTAIFEILNPDHQHVEDLSYLSRPELKFITWTSNELDCTKRRSSSLCYTSPRTAIELARDFGLPTVDYEQIKVEAVEERMRSIRLAYGYEGEVLYFVDQHDDVIGLLKKKTIWYIVCRAIREKVRTAAFASFKKKANFQVSRSHSQMERRIRDIQSWLALDDLAVAKWIDLGCTFSRWAIDKSGRENIPPDKLSALFPVYWLEFLKEHPEKTDKIEVKLEDSRG